MVRCAKNVTFCEKNEALEVFTPLMPLTLANSFRKP